MPRSGIPLNELLGPMPVTHSSNMQGHTFTTLFVLSAALEEIRRKIAAGTVKNYICDVEGTGRSVA